jgi:hypothetical protein
MGSCSPETRVQIVTRISPSADRAFRACSGLTGSLGSPPPNSIGRAAERPGRRSRYACPSRGRRTGGAPHWAPVVPPPATPGPAVPIISTAGRPSARAAGSPSSPASRCSQTPAFARPNHSHVAIAHLLNQAQKPTIVHINVSHVYRRRQPTSERCPGGLY